MSDLKIVVKKSPHSRQNLHTGGQKPGFLLNLRAATRLFVKTRFLGLPA